ncbi:hypothetical protein ABK040_011188 [Willaertia magna]
MLKGYKSLFIASLLIVLFCSVFSFAQVHVTTTEEYLTSFINKELRKAERKIRKAFAKRRRNELLADELVSEDFDELADVFMASFATALSDSLEGGGSSSSSSSGSSSSSSSSSSGSTGSGGSAFSSIGSSLGSLGRTIGNIGSSLGKSIGSAIGSIGSSIGSSFSSIGSSSSIGRIGSSVSSVFGRTASTIGSSIGSHIGSIGSTIGSTYNTINSISSKPGFTSIGNSFANSIGNSFSNTFGKIGSGLTNSFSKIGTSVSRTIGSSFSPIGSAFSSIPVIGPIGKAVGTSVGKLAPIIGSKIGSSIADTYGKSNLINTFNNMKNNNNNNYNGASKPSFPSHTKVLPPPRPKVINNTAPQQKQTTNTPPSSIIAQPGSAMGSKIANTIIARVAGNTKSTGKCAKSVREAIEAATGKTIERTNSAKDYGKSLKKAGFKEVSGAAKEGDVAIFNAQPGHPHVFKKKNKSITEEETIDQQDSTKAILFGSLQSGKSALLRQILSFSNAPTKNREYKEIIVSGIVGACQVFIVNRKEIESLVGEELMIEKEFIMKIKDWTLFMEIIQLKKMMEFLQQNIHILQNLMYNFRDDYNEYILYYLTRINSLITYDYLPNDLDVHACRFKTVGCTRNHLKTRIMPYLKLQELEMKEENGKLFVKNLKINLLQST